MRVNKGGLTATLAVGATTALLAAGCGGSAKAGSSGSSSPKVKLALVAYSTPQAAYKDIIKAFQATPAGKNISFTESYGVTL